MEHSPLETVAVLSFFLHRIPVVRVYLYIATTTLDPAGRDPRQVIIIVVIVNQSKLYLFFVILAKKYIFDALPNLSN